MTTKYEPLKEQEDGVEGAVFNTLPCSQLEDDGVSKHGTREWLRLVFEAILVLTVVLLALKLVLIDTSLHKGRPRGPNDPKKDCMSPEL